MRVLLLQKGDERVAAHTSKAIERLRQELNSRNVKFTASQTIDDAKNIIKSNLPIDCLLIAKTSFPLEEFSQRDEDAAEDAEVALIDQLHQRQPRVPVFLLTDRDNLTQSLSLQLAQRVTEFVWIFEDSLDFVAGRVLFAIQRYAKGLMPPLISALKDYHQTYEYSWVIPGHQGGVGLTKTPMGRQFHDFFGEHLFQTDLNSARNPLGSLLEHTGAFKESEANIARIFGADLSFSGVVGGSGSNRSVMQFCIREGDTVAVDRNCHKSVAQGMVLTGAKPVYMKPHRNYHGTVGPVGAAEIRQAMTSTPAYGVLTNCTFDGICYNSAKVEQLMKDVPYLHLDEAWFAHARFNPLYEGLNAMRGDPQEDADTRQPTIFVTHSSHKMLNALGMGAFIHMRRGRKRPVSAAEFNEAYMMHTTTSPSYPIAASNDIAAHMMDGETGLSLTQEVINEAVAFRQLLARMHAKFAKKNDWFFKPWNIDEYEGVPFEKLNADDLATKQQYWMLKPGDSWHGFTELRDTNWAMLDPIKVTILTPGLNTDGTFSADGVAIPAALLNIWLVHKGIVPTRYSDFQVLFLFTMGITKGKWGTLLEGLHSFKRHFDANTPLKYILPELSQSTHTYDGKGLRDLANDMVAFMKAKQLPKLLYMAFDSLPKVADNMRPKDGYQRLIAGKAQPTKLKDLLNRVAATPVLPYPPGIPMVISGERFAKEHVDYLSALEEWDKRFPGFGHDTTGVEIEDDGSYHLLCLKDEPKQIPPIK